MRLAIEGLIHKPKGKEKYWAVGVPLLEIYSQGTSKKNALQMIWSAIEEAVGQKGFRVKVELTGKDTFAVSAKDFGTLLSFMLRQKRVSKKLTLRDAAKRLESASPNAYSRYERGESGASLEKLAELMGAVAEEKYLLLKAG
ncbi:MAG: helix-turn-helix transcriptional regulator [Acidobacteria bacterium]|nr:helix-turn-helix transcriptional regulator [Acidobacteriota bacterium]MBI3655147.1 helix-turn-helix transcriptional regulator [Acidobacteriota bacterium]